MKILSIKINNILSIENAEVTFDDSGLMLVKGWDYDNGRANGAGKTAIFNALSFALYDKLPRKVTATEILRRGCKTGRVEVKLSAGQDSFTVIRSRPKGVRFLDSNDNPLTMTQEEWESKLKLNYNQFTKIAYCTQGASDRFLSTNDADKKKFLLQLLDLDRFAAAKKVADEKIKIFSAQVEAESAKAGAIVSKIEAYSESFVDEDSINDKILTVSSDVVELSKELGVLRAVTKPDLSKYQKLEDEVFQKRSELLKIRTRRELLHDNYKKLNAQKTQFAGATSCSACGSELDVSAAKAAHKREQETITEELLLVKEQIDECDTALAKEQQINELHLKLRNKKKIESSDYETATTRAAEVQSSINIKQQELKNLNLKLQNNSELQNKINILKDALQILNTSIGDTQSKIELYKTVSAMYSPTGAQAYILDSVVESFNDCIQEYIKLLWSNVSYSLLSYKENDAGDVTAKFSELLVMDGNEVSIGSLSGGEYRALSLCVDFALVDVMQRQFGIYVSPIVLDEPFDGLDSEGRELIVDLLTKIAHDRHIIVIDHSSELKSMFSKTLMVEKRNGVSNISLDV